MPSLPRAISNAVYQRDSWKCRHCGNRQTLDPHHVIYRSAGGSDEMSNLLTLCRHCHIDGVHGGKLRIEVLRTTARDLEVKFWHLEGWKP
jgi:5-methylcytosine-specific restriction endonuclease McrA